MKKVFITKNSRETYHIGKQLAEKILRRLCKIKLSDTLILELIGDLGGGKTTFLQGFAKGLGIKEKIISPTFVIAKNYKIPSIYNKDRRIGCDARKTFCHVDCYRLGKVNKGTNLMLKKFIFGSHRVVAIEWAEIISKIIPPNTIKLRFLFVGKNTRKIIINLPLKLAREICWIFNMP